jgi:hypothetical protein
MSHHKRWAAAIVILLAIVASTAHAQKGTTTALAPVTPELRSQFETAIGALQSTVRAWVAAQAAAYRSASSIRAGTTSLRDAARKRFALSEADDAALQALTFVTMMETLKSADEQHRYYLRQITAINDFAKAMAGALAALAEASSSLAGKETSCDAPACDRFRAAYARLLSLKSPVAEVSLPATEVRNEADLNARRTALAAAEAKINAERSKIDEMRREAAERYDAAMTAANAALSMAVAAGSVSTASATAPADSTPPLMKRLLVRLK